MSIADQPRQLDRQGQHIADPRLEMWVGIAIIAAFSLFIYWPALSGNFILDDDVYLTSNRVIAAGDGLYRFWFTTQGIDYYPVSNSSLWLEWRLWGLHPSGYHVTNLLIHIFSALVLWGILKRLAVPGAFLAAVIFAVHPLNVESVAWIAQRKNVLAVLFSLLSIWFYLEDKPSAEPHNRPLYLSGRGYWLSLLMFVLAMLSKGSAAIVPLLFLALDWWRNKRLIWARIAALVPFFMIGGVLTLLNIWVQTRGSGEIIRAATLPQRLCEAGATTWFYLAKALLPLDLVFVYPRWEIDAGQLRWWIPLLATTAVTALLICFRARRWMWNLLAAWIFFCAALLPVMGFTDTGFMRYSLVADHYASIALVSVAVMAAAAWQLWHDRLGGVARMFATVAMMCIIGLLALATWRQSQQYRGPFSLYPATLEKNPRSSMAYFNLANAVLRSDRAADALKLYDMALAIKPNNSQAQANRAAALASLGRLPAAIEQYQQALLSDPENFDAWANMALSEARMNKPTEAIDSAQRAVELAHKHGDDAFAQEVASWLTSYRATVEMGPTEAFPSSPKSNAR